MKRTLLVTLSIADHEDISAYADEVLTILTDEGLPAITCIPWGQVSEQPPEELLGQNPFPTAQPVSQPDAFAAVTPSDPWLP